MRKLLNDIRRRRLFGTLALYFIGAWGVLQVADLLFPGWQIPESAIRYVWIGTALLLPIAILFSWRYDVSAKGLRRTPARGEETRPPLKRFDTGLLSLMAVLTMGICSAVTYQVLETRDAAASAFAAIDVPANSVAVLPFVNMSGEDDEYFSDGITEQLLNELARMPELHVAARTSSFYFKDRNEDMRSIGRQLGVRSLLEGSVRRSGRHIRITAQLIDAENGFHLWSQTFDRELEDIFEVQDEIALAIANTLAARIAHGDIGRTRAPVTANAEAFDLYLRAWSARREFNVDALQRSNELMVEAIEIQPDFAVAIADLAYGKVLQAWYGSIELEEATLEVHELLERALEIRPDMEEAYNTYGLLFSLRNEHTAANEAFDRALDINPNHYGALVNYGLASVRQGRLKQASALYLRAQAVDPMNANLHFNLGASMMLQGEFDSGAALMRRTLELDPERADVERALAHWHRAYGRLAESLVVAEVLYAKEKDNLAIANLLGSLYLDIGRIDDARQVLAAAQEIDPHNFRVRDIERTLAMLDGDDDTFAERVREEYELIDALPGETVAYNDSHRIYWYAWVALMQGEYEIAAENLWWAAGGDDGIAETTYDLMHNIKLLALAYRRLGRDEESTALAEQCLALAEDANRRGWATPQFYYRVAEIHAMQADERQAIEYLTQAYERGWREILWLEYSLFWEELSDNTDLERIKRLIYEDIERQLPLDTV